MEEKQKDQSDFFKKQLVQVGPEAAAQLLAGIFGAQRELELEKKRTEQETAKALSNIRSKDISFGLESQINPLKALIANYRAAIK